MNEKLTIEDQLAMMREGRSAPISFKMGETEIPCRVLTGNELVRIEQDVLVRQQELKDAERTEAWLLHEVRKLTLEQATKIGGEPVGALHRKLLDAMSHDEVIFAYRQYLDILMAVNPILEQMTDEDLEALVDAVKKDPSWLSECTTPRLVAMLQFVLGLDRVAPHPGKSFGSF